MRSGSTSAHLAVADVALRARDTRGVVRRTGRSRSRRRRGASALRALPPLERRVEQALRLRRFRSKLERAPELRRAASSRSPRSSAASPVRDVEQRVLGAIAGGDELAPFFELRRAFLLAARPHEREPELVVGLAALRLEPHGVLQRRHRVGRLAVLQQRLAEREVRPREVGSHLDHLLEVLDFLRWPVSGTGPVGHGKVEEGLHRVGASRTASSSSLIAASASVGVNAAPRFVRASA